MIRLVAAALAIVLFIVPLLMAPEKVVAVIGLAGLLLAAAGIIARWRWPVTGAAGVFLVEYALALWVAEVSGSAASGSIVGAAAFGLAILLLLQSADLALRARHAIVDAAVLRAQLGRWIALGVGGLAAVMLAVVLAGALAPALPPAASPFLAAAGALGIVLTVATSVVHAARSAAQGTGEARRSTAAEH